tara:strand:- start:464 stop:718 length:255 start_codon:yes stop_codon:yes gene_type:complete
MPLTGTTTLGVALPVVWTTNGHIVINFFVWAATARVAIGTIRGRTETVTVTVTRRRFTCVSGATDLIKGAIQVCQAFHTAGGHV